MSETPQNIIEIKLAQMLAYAEAYRSLNMQARQSMDWSHVNLSDDNEPKYHVSNPPTVTTVSMALNHAVAEIAHHASCTVDSGATGI